MTVRANIAGDVLTTPILNAPSKTWTGGVPNAVSSLNRSMTVRLAPGDRLQIGICGFYGTIALAVLRLHSLPGKAPALLCGTPALPGGTREFQAEMSWDLPSLAPGITNLLDVIMAKCREVTWRMPRSHRSPAFRRVRPLA